MDTGRFIVYPFGGPYEQFDHQVEVFCDFTPRALDPPKAANTYLDINPRNNYAYVSNLYMRPKTDNECEAPCIWSWYWANPNICKDEKMDWENSGRTNFERIRIIVDKENKEVYIDRLDRKFTQHDPIHADGDKDFG